MATIVGKKNAPAGLYDLTPYLAAGIDPKTGLPIKMAQACDEGTSKEAIRASLRILDEQNAVTRYT